VLFVSGFVPLWFGIVLRSCAIRFIVIVRCIKDSQLFQDLLIAVIDLCQVEIVELNRLTKAE
jgi:hypothetical protein